MKKKLFFILMVLFVFCMMTGCVKVTHTESIEVEAKIIKTYHRGAFLVGKVMQPAINRVTLEYDGVTYTINKRDAYNLCKNKNGSIAICTLETYYYDDGTQRSFIKNIKSIKE